MAQSNQYKRAKKPEAVAPAPPAPDSKTPATGDASKPADLNKKVDITDLEQKYWVPKDTEFRVVQNRTYTKENRFAVTLSGGPLINDQYSKAFIYALTGNYYFSERLGAELTFMDYDTKNNIMTETFIGQYATAPEHNKESTYIGAGVNWVPIYAKLALLEKQIIYFDMSFSAGLGVTTYDQQLTNMPMTKSQAPTLALDVAQHFFLDKHFALRFELRNHFLKWDIKDSKTGVVDHSTTTNSNVILFGLTYYH